MEQTPTHAPVLYWFPGQRTVPDEYQHRFRDPATGRDRFTAARDSAGPVDDARGMLIAPRDNVFLRFQPDRQRWDEIGEGVWIGADTGATPDDFARPEGLYAGTYVTLADGNDWCLPVANPMVKTCTLPVWHRLNKRKQWEAELKNAYRDLGQRAADISTELISQVTETGSSQVDVDDDQLRRVLVDALRVNYDITEEELSVLRVFSPEVYWPALSAIIDWETQMQILLAEEQEASAVDPFSDSENTATTAGGAEDG